jgi:hypothetical protein
LIVLIVWAVSDWFSQGIALRPRATVAQACEPDLIRAAQFAIGEELRTEFQTSHELPGELRTRMEELDAAESGVRHSRRLHAVTC